MQITASFRDYKSGQEGLQTFRDLRDFKSGQKDYKSGQTDFISRQRLQIGARKITDWGKDFKSGQELQIGAEQRKSSSH